jgi:hypothetical protein
MCAGTDRGTTASSSPCNAPSAPVPVPVPLEGERERGREGKIQIDVTWMRNTQASYSVPLNQKSRSCHAAFLKKENGAGTPDAN